MGENVQTSKTSYYQSIGQISFGAKGHTRQPGKANTGVDQRLITTPDEKFALAQQLKLHGNQFTHQARLPRIPQWKKTPFGIPTIEDRAKQMLAYLALCPQWEAQFEADSYGFRPGRSVLDAIETVSWEFRRNQNGSRRRHCQMF
jgi:RNA-directed DNA polymerase